jgi:hypothetical protein
MMHFSHSRYAEFSQKNLAFRWRQRFESLPMRFESDPVRLSWHMAWSFGSRSPNSSEGCAIE